jgi:hypothetical protein
MKILLLITVLFLISCSQYENSKYSCDGSINTNLVYEDGNFSNTTSDNQKIGMRIDSQKVYLSGSTLILGDGVPICRIGTIELAKKDEMYFDNSGCKMKIDLGSKTHRTFGTFNFITKKLVVTSNLDTHGFNYNTGTYNCTKTN